MTIQVRITSDIVFANDQPLQFIVGPCAIESRAFALETAHALTEMFARLGHPFVYKSSFDKANRSSGAGFRGVGLDEGLAILGEVRNRYGVPVLTDVHEVSQIAPAAQVVDMLQTPAFLCRQTDFIEAVARSGKPVNVKKGQFLAPWEMANVLDKARAAGSNAITLCERGTSFGYGNLVVDMRGLAIMAKTGAPVVFDATHSVQLPGANGGSSGGQREFVPTLARAAVAAGVAGVFLEAHPQPDRAPCDGPNMVPFAQLPALVKQLLALDALVKA
jgi:2-dehydro-3-deoxyphosphooctonate aldolase (KDO 8-P synthase)